LYIVCLLLWAKLPEINTMIVCCDRISQIVRNLTLS